MDILEKLAHLTPVLRQGDANAGRYVADIIEKIKQYRIPFDVYWFDAGWYGTGVVPSRTVFDGDWAIMAGDWRPHANWHNGTLRPVSDAAHAAGMKFLVWVEPCRAIHGRPVTLAHPEYFLTANRDGKIRDGQTLLLDLGKPEAFKWAVDIVAGLTETHDIDWYEEDFNIEPNSYLETAAEPNRWGMNEAPRASSLQRGDGPAASMLSPRQRFAMARIETTAEDAEQRGAKK